MIRRLSSDLLLDVVELTDPLKRLLGDRCVGGDMDIKVVLPIELALRQMASAGIAPSLIAMRPQPADHPMVESVEELADMGLTVVIAPARMIGKRPMEAVFRSSVASV